MDNRKSHRKKQYNNLYLPTHLFNLGNKEEVDKFLGKVKNILL